MRGSAGQKRVPADFLETLEIPLPELPRQRRIATILERADRLRRLRRSALGIGADFLAACFVREFGDPISNPLNWEAVQLNDICELVRGSSPRPQGDPRFFKGPVPRLMIADITRDGVYVTPRIDSLTTEGAERSRPMTRGSVVMAVSGDVGLPAILACDACIHDGFVGFRSLGTELLPIYFYFVLKIRQARNRAMATGAIWQNLTTDQVKEWRIPIPPRSRQEQFANLVAYYDRLSLVHHESLRQAEHVFQTLLQRAFTSGL
jgi:restriction endonuclease S subunit